MEITTRGLWTLIHGMGFGGLYLLACSGAIVELCAPSNALGRVLMEPTNANSTRKLLLWSLPIVLGHFVAVIWHLLLLVKVQPSTPRFFPPLLILFNLFPVAGLVALAKGFLKLAGSMIILPLAISWSSAPTHIF